MTKRFSLTILLICTAVLPVLGQPVAAFRDFFWQEASAELPPELLNTPVQLQNSQVGTAALTTATLTLEDREKTRAIFFRPAGSRQFRLLIRNGDPMINREEFWSMVFLGPNAVYFNTFCLQNSFPTVPTPCVTWKIPLNGGTPKRLVGYGDVVSFKLQGGLFGTMRGPIRFFFYPVYPSLDGSKELVYLSIARPDGLVWYNGIYELKNDLLEQIYFPPSFNSRGSFMGIFSPDGKTIWFDEYTTITDLQLIRFEVATNKTESLIRQGAAMGNDLVRSWWLTPSLAPFGLYIHYDTGMAIRLVSLLPTPTPIASTEDVIPEFGKPINFGGVSASGDFALVGLRYFPVPYEPTYLPWLRDALAVYDLREKTLTPLIKVGERLPNGKVANGIGDAVVIGCEVELLTTSASPASNFRPQNTNAFYRIFKPCVQQFPALVTPEQEIVMRGQNFLVGDIRPQDVDVLLNGTVPVKPRRVSATEIAFALPPSLALDSEVKVQGRLTHPTGVVKSGSVTIKIQQPPITLLPITALTSAAGRFLPGPRSSYELVSIFGTNLTAATITGSIPYPLELLGLRVLVDSEPAGLQFVSPSQVNLLLPKLTAGRKSRLVVERLNAQGQVIARSAPFEFEVEEATPDFFSFTSNRGVSLPIMQNMSQDASGNTLVTEDNPAQPGNILVMYATGFGLMEPEIQYRFPAGSTLARLRVALKVFVNGAEAQAEAAYSPQFPGVWQINVVVPDMDPSMIGTSAEMEVQVGPTARVNLLLPL